MHRRTSLPAPWYRRWYRSFREKYWPEAAEVNGRTLRIDDPIAAYSWMEKVKESQRPRGYYDYENDKYIIEQLSGGNTLFGVAIKPRPSSSQSPTVSAPSK